MNMLMIFYFLLWLRESYVIQQRDLAYGCDHCKIYLHKSCMELPGEIHHPFHHHILSFSKNFILSNMFWITTIATKACHKHCYGFIYSCEKCNFYLGITCAALRPSIQYEGHDHILTLFEKLYFIPKWAACNFASCDASVLRCLKCNCWRRNLVELDSSLITNPCINIKFVRWGNSLPIVKDATNTWNHKGQ